MKKLSSIPLVLALLSAGAMAQQQPQAAQQQRETPGPVSYTHLTLPTKA